MPLPVAVAVKPWPLPEMAQVTVKLAGVGTATAQLAEQVAGQEVLGLGVAWTMGKVDRFLPEKARSSTVFKQPEAPKEPAVLTADETVQLSPFQVNTEKDKGYRATNSISGSRLDTAIKDIPMPIEVITEQFLKDTGSQDLRQSLRYSAGIQLQSSLN